MDFKKNKTKKNPDEISSTHNILSVFYIVFYMLRFDLHINISGCFNGTFYFFSCALNSYSSWSLVALVLKRCAWAVEQDIH